MFEGTVRCVLTSFLMSVSLFRIVNCDVLVKQSLAEDSKVGEAIKSFMDKRMDGRTPVSLVKPDVELDLNFY